MIQPNLIKLVGTRVAMSLLVLWVVSLAAFALTDSLPGDFASVNASREASVEDIDQVRREYGLYLPLHSRYFLWASKLLQGDFGRSWMSQREIGPILATRFGRSLLLAGLVALVALPIAISLGIWSVLRLHTQKDRLASSITIIGISIPEFVMAYALLYVFAVKLPWLPAFTAFYRGTPISEQLIGLILPVAVLSVVTIAPVMRLTRASIANVLTSEYIEMAHRKGMSPRRIVLVHALPNALGPIAHAIVLTFSNLLLGMVVIEYIFSYPGVGRLMVDAVLSRDLPMMMACTLVFAVAYILLNLGADLVSIFSNPRLRYPTSSRAVRFGMPRITPQTKVAIICGTLAAVVITTYLINRKPTVIRKPVESVREVKWPTLFPPMSNERDRLTVESLTQWADAPLTAAHYSYFSPPEFSQAAHHAFIGELRVPAFDILRGNASRQSQTRTWKFPGFRSRFVSTDGHLIPHQRGMIGDDKRSHWKVILAPGKTWSEATDREWSRAAFPFTLINRRGGVSHNGVAMFVYRGLEISNLRIQIAQEANPGSYTDYWGQADVFYLPQIVDKDDKKTIREFQRELQHRIPVKPWKELENFTRAEILDTFDGRANLHRITMSGFLVNDTAYMRTCRTRLGPFPFCEEMRHSVYSISKSMGGLIGMLWLAQKYGDDVFDERIVDYVPLESEHDGWSEVTFGDTLNMATGVGSLVPSVVDHYVETDNTQLTAQVFNAQRAAEKLWLIGSDKNYTWGPGEVFRYRTTDTFLLSAAMDAFLKQQEGDHVRLWESLHREVFNPLGIKHIPVLETIENDSTHPLPLLGWGMLMTFNDTLKVAKLLQDGGSYKEQQLLSETKIAEALSNEREDGLPTSWDYPEGGEARYHMSLWRGPHYTDDCTTEVQYMSGYGGNYVLMLPNNMIAVRFADGGYNADETWDHWDMRNVADSVNRFCG